MEGEIASPRSPVSPLSPDESVRDRLPPDDGESSADDVSHMILHLPDDDGESSDEERGGNAKSFYVLRKEMVEKKRAQQKRLNGASDEIAAEPEARNGSNGFQTKGARDNGVDMPSGKASFRRRRNSDKVNYVYSSFMPAFALRRLKQLMEVTPSFEARAPAAVITMRVAGLTTLMHQLNTQFVGPQKLCAELDNFFNHLSHSADACGGDVVKIIGDSILFVFAVDGDEGPSSLGDATKAAAKFARQVHVAIKARQVSVQSPVLSDRHPENESQAVDGVQLNLSSGLGCGTISCFNLLPTGSDGLSANAEFVIAGSPLEQTRRAIAEANNDIVCSKVSWNFLRRVYEGTEENGDLVRLGELLEKSDDEVDERTKDHPENDDVDTLGDENEMSPPVVTEPSAHRASFAHDIDILATYHPRLRPDLSGALVGVDLRKLTMFLPRSFDRALRFRYSYASYLEHGNISEVRDLTVCSLRIYGVDFVEPAFDLCQEVLSCVNTTVDRMHGSTIKVQCDGLGIRMLLCFGLPGSVYDQSATRALAAVYLLKDRIATHLGAGLRFYVGIATSWAFCGVIGSPLRMDYVVAGDAVNTARKLENACGTPSVPTFEPGHVILMCGVTKRHTENDLRFAECRDVLPAGVRNSRAYAPVAWRQRISLHGFPRLFDSHKSRKRQVAEIFETRTKETCVIGGGRSASAARAFADENVPIMSQLHKMTLLRTDRSKSAYDDGALGLSTICGAWRGPLSSALDVIEAALRKRPSFGVRILRSPSRSGHTSEQVVSSRSQQSPRSSIDSVPLSPHLQSPAGSPWRSSTSFRMLFNPQGSAAASPGGMSRSPHPSNSSRRIHRPAKSQPNLMRGRSLGHMLSGKRAISSNDADSRTTRITLIGRTNAVLGALPIKLRKYAPVLNDMFMPDERNPDLGDERHLENLTLMMRRARLVQLVVMLVLQASKRARLTLLLDNLDQMDDTAWDVLYKLTQWQKKASRRTMGKRRAASIASIIKSIGTNGASNFLSTMDEAQATSSRRSKFADGIDVLQYSGELASPNQFLVFVVAPYFSVAGADRAEWLEIRRQAQEAETYIEMATLGTREARLFAAERIKLCNAESTKAVKDHAIELVAGCRALDELVQSAKGETDVLSSILTESIDAGRVKVVNDEQDRPTLRVSQDINAMDLPHTHAASRLAMVDELSVWKQHVLFAASVFKREFTPRLLVEIALEGMDPYSVAAVCQELCSPQESGHTLFNQSAMECQPSLIGTKKNCDSAEELMELGCDGRFSTMANVEDHDDKTNPPTLLQARRDEIFAFSEPLVQRALASKLTEPQMEAVFRRIQTLPFSHDDCDRLRSFTLPYLARKHARAISLRTAQAAKACGDPCSDVRPSSSFSSFSELGDNDSAHGTRFNALSPDGPLTGTAASRATRHNHVHGQLRPASYVTAM